VCNNTYEAAKFPKACGISPRNAPADKSSNCIAHQVGTIGLCIFSGNSRNVAAALMAPMLAKLENIVIRDRTILIYLVGTTKYRQNAFLLMLCMNGALTC